MCEMKLTEVLLIFGKHTCVDSAHDSRVYKTRRTQELLVTLIYDIGGMGLVD